MNERIIQYDCFLMHNCNRWVLRQVFWPFAIGFFSIFSCSAQNPDSLRSEITQFFKNQNYQGYPLLSKATKEIGHRLTGSPNGRLAETFVFNQLKAAGIDDVVFDTFSVKVWNRRSCDLEVVPYRSDNYAKIKAVSLANTPSSDVMPFIVDGGDGLESDLKKLGEKIKDKCLLINLGLTQTDSNRQNLHRAEKVSLAIKYGAKAVLMVHPEPGDRLLTGTASLTGEVIAIPALCISGNEGKEVRNWLKTERLMAQIRVRNEVSPGFARNVIATIPAPKPTKETIVFCGHLDSWDISTGATDNGLGSFTLIDVARAVHQFQSKLNRNVVILWTMGEEQGLLGSTHFVENLKKNDKLNTISAVVNLDMIGNPNGFNTTDWPKAEKWFGGFTGSFSKFCPTFTNKATSGPGLHSDHQPFMLEGIPTFSANSNMPDSIYRCYHANCDDISLVNPQYLESSALVHSMLAFELAGKKPLPFERMSSKKLQKWLEKHNLKEKLVISNQWRWKK